MDFVLDLTVQYQLRGTDLEIETYHVTALFIVKPLVAFHISASSGKHA